MISPRNETIVARIFAGLTLTLGCLWLYALARLLQWAKGMPDADPDTEIGLFLFLFSMHFIGAWLGSRASIRGSVAMLGANAFSLIGPTFLNLPLVLQPKWQLVMLAVVAALVVFVFVQIGAARKSSHVTLGVEK